MMYNGFEETSEPYVSNGASGDCSVDYVLKPLHLIVSLTKLMTDVFSNA